VSDAPAVEMRGVRFAYDGDAVIVDADLRIALGDFACIIGPNGGGKSTLLKLMLGLLRPAAGEVRVLGRRPAAARAEMGYIPQRVHFDPLFPIRVIDVVRMNSLRLAGLGAARGAQRALAALEAVKLADLRLRPFASLSGGQRQRVLIARALACEPKVLLLDEPASNLDIVAEEGLYELLFELNRKWTIVMVSHDMVFVSKYVKTTVCVNRAVHTHTRGELSGEVINRLFGREVRMVPHHSDAGHVHGPDCHHIGESPESRA